jgi:8-oxo-dGTP pyrophosphatase MutT (NUDIX family)
MWEETGLRVELTRVIGVYGGPEFTTSYRNGDRVSFTMIVFEARTIGGTLRPDGDETLDVRWVAADELSELHLQPWAPQVLHNAWADRDSARFDPPLERLPDD